MSKFYILVHNIEKLRKEIEDIQKSNDEIKKDKDNEKGEAILIARSAFNIFGTKDISREIYQGKDDEDEIKNIYDICDKNYAKLANEVIYVNVKREELWKSIRDIQEYLSNLGILTENKTDYSEFTLENIEIPKLDKEISFLNNKLEVLERDARKNDVEYGKYEGTLTTIKNRFTNFFGSVKAERKLEAINIAQKKLYVTLRFYFDYYKDSLKLQKPYLEECIKTAKLYRESLNNLLDTIDKKILPFLEISNLFLKSLIIKELVKENKLNENMSLKDIESPKSIGNLKDTKYNIYYTFFENLFHLYTSIETAFKENILTNLMFFKNDYLEGDELQDIESKIRDSAKTYPEFGTFDWIISIDTSEEEYIYSAKDIKFLNYSKSIKEAEEKIKIINEKIADVKKNLDEIEEISNELE
ncbi:hypothetical protein CI111_01930 [Fusobacterium animalis]|uniref:Uncharacterized protein n=1 Tax=Fusobacterium animalis TaxID=76859 RepID=A0A2G9FKX5_9FUSO|nr:hypothetical protein [Fusobacterium animalis]PIM93354.1 hypothetical protein CI114_01680 [Fusobacterium animalis]PIM94414.1 hypothetical protein CI111_01930 [Fusobacterium animalis]